VEVEGFDVKDEASNHAGDDSIDYAFARVVRAELEEVFGGDEGLSALLVSGGEVVIRGGERLDGD